ncbi:MAG: AIPR family protein [Ignavibacteriales bacterium]|nr:MAG: AIPR family protein [Ignavibacteriales bacterium]
MIKTKIERYCEKFISENYDKKDRRKADDKKFEWFINSMHCWQVSSQSYNSKNRIGKDISLGSAQGGDAFFVLLKGQIYSLNDNIDDIITELEKEQTQVDITFHYIQTKNSLKADLGDFKKFSAIPLMILKKSKIDDSKKELKLLELFINKILERKFKNVVYKFELFFYTNKNDNEINVLKKNWKDEIEYISNDYKEYVDVSIELRGSDFINNLFERFISNEFILYVSKQNVKQVTSKDKTHCLIGYISAKELLDCIAPIHTNTNQRVLLPDVFNNNIRLYLGETDVNQNIERTLIEEPELFHLYNNGITITTKDVNTSTIDLYSITPVNIVNGCQTANSVFKVLSALDNSIESKVLIPVKIVKLHSDDENKLITIRSNSQNGISEKDLISITNIQIDLEQLFKRHKIHSHTFFYKRQNSYADSNIAGYDFIINVSDILRALFSTLMLMPHKVTSYFDRTTQRFIDTIFEERFLNLYHIITVLYKLVEDYLEENHPEIQRLKFHITFIVYRLINKSADINLLDKYLRDNKSNIDTIKEEESKKQNEVARTITSNLFNLLKSDSGFEDCLKYIIEILNSNYPEYLDLSTKEKERVLYLSVANKFSNFDSVFIKSSKDFVKK